LNVISKVEPLPHRLGLLREIDNVKIYDDGICTSAHSLSAALSSFEEKLVLIA
jgi:UDP-N-acetylmuramoylalanine-D-glutamate ligase